MFVFYGLDFYKYYLPLGQLIPVRFIQNYMNRFYRQFDSLIGVSTKARNYFKQKGMIPKTPSVIVPNAIDEGKFQQKHLSSAERKKIRKLF